MVRHAGTARSPNGTVGWSIKVWKPPDQQDAPRGHSQPFERSRDSGMLTAY